jgi:hypothetical protein
MDGREGGERKQTERQTDRQIKREVCQKVFSVQYQEHIHYTVISKSKVFDLWTSAEF